MDNIEGFPILPTCKSLALAAAISASSSSAMSKREKRTVRNFL